MRENWATGCAIAQLGAAPLAAATGGKTIRCTLVCQRAGPAFRLVLGEKYGKKPVRYGRAVVEADSKQFTLTFDGGQEVRVEPGATVCSDPVAHPITAGAELTLWLYNSGKKASTSLSYTKQQHSAPGDFCGEAFAPEPYSNKLAAKMNMAEVLGGVLGIEVMAGEADGIVAFGDSITALDIWVSPLRQQLQESGAGRPVFNLGISGNRLLRDTHLTLFPGVQVYGKAGLVRIEWDLLGFSGIQTVILALGINDISQPGGTRGISPPAKEVCTKAQLLEGYAGFLEAAHKAGIKVVGATLTPFGGYATYTEEKEQMRREVNEWILQSGRFDGTLEYAEAICDKQNPHQLAEQYDSGDHLHPNAAGGLAMAAVAAACPQLQ